MTNLLTNGNFANNFTSWFKEGNSEQPVIITNQSFGPYTNANAVNLPVNSFIYQHITTPLLANITYYFSFYVKCNIASSGINLLCIIGGISETTITTFSNLSNLSTSPNSNGTIINLNPKPNPNTVYFHGYDMQNYVLVSGNFTLSQNAIVTIALSTIVSSSPSTPFKVGNVFLGTQSSPEPPCFNKGTNILCLNSNNEEEYVPVEQLKSGDLVKTYNNGYKKIDTIAHTTLQNNVDVFTQCMYIMPKQNDMIDDLIVTGGHSILVDNYKSEQVKNHHKRLFGKLDLIDNKYLLLAGQTPLFKQITDDKVYDIYHLCLEGDNKNEDRRYGIWANGVLTESTYKSIIYNRIFNIDYHNNTNVGNKSKNAMLQMIKHKRTIIF